MGEFYIAIPIALAILAFVFGTLAFLVPFVLAAFAIPVTLGLIWVFANFLELTTYLQNLVMLIGLGIAVDYSLLVVYRYREELRRNGGSREDALVRTMNTAGRAVVFSGTAVGIGLALMLFMPLPFMRGFGLGGLVIPIVSVAAGLTILPVLLYCLGHRLDRIRFVPRWVEERRADHEANFWGRLSRVVMRRPAFFAAATTAILLALTRLRARGGGADRRDDRAGVARAERGDALMGRWNWWLPDGLGRALRVEPWPLERAPQPAYESAW